MVLKNMAQHWILIAAGVAILGLVTVAGVSVNQVFAGGNGSSGQCQDDGEENDDSVVETPEQKAADDAADVAAGCVDDGEANDD